MREMVEQQVEEEKKYKDPEKGKNSGTVGEAVTGNAFLPLGRAD